MNLSKHVNVSYHDEKQLSSDIRSPLYMRHEPVLFEGSNRIYEVVKQKKVIVDHIPVSTAFFILSHAKLHVLKVTYKFNNIIKYIYISL